MEKFRDLRWWSGLFPFWLRSLAPIVWLLWIPFRHSEFGWKSRKNPKNSIQCSTSGKLIKRLALKLFRGEPAISRHDWLFTSYHSSSQSFARLTGSGLLLNFFRIHPGHGKLVWFRVVFALQRLKRLSGFALLRLGFPMSPPFSDGLDLQRKYTRWLVLQKAPRHPA